MIPFVECRTADEVVRLARAVRLKTLRTRGVQSGPQRVVFGVVMADNAPSEPAPEEPLSIATRRDIAEQKKRRAAANYRLLNRMSLAKGGSGRPSIAFIWAFIAGRFELTPGELASPRRVRNIAWARQVGFWAIREIRQSSLHEIGGSLGGTPRDHTTVLHAVRKVDGMIAVDPEFASEMQSMLDAIRAEWEASVCGVAEAVG